MIDIAYIAIAAAVIFIALAIYGNKLKREGRAPLQKPPKPPKTFTSIRVKYIDGIVGFQEEIAVTLELLPDCLSIIQDASRQATLQYSKILYSDAVFIRLVTSGSAAAYNHKYRVIKYLSGNNSEKQITFQNFGDTGDSKIFLQALQEKIPSKPPMNIEL